MEITGKLIVKGDTVVVSDKFKKRTFVVEIGLDTKYPQPIELQLSQDKCDLLNKFNVGDTITAHINFNGRAWKNQQGETKYFNTISAWKIDLAKNSEDFNPNPNVGKTEEEIDEMPF